MKQKAAKHKVMKFKPGTLLRHNFNHAIVMVVEYNLAVGSFKGYRLFRLGKNTYQAWLEYTSIVEFSYKELKFAEKISHESK